MIVVFDIGNSSAKVARLSSAGDLEEVHITKLTDVATTITSFVDSDVRLAIVASSGDKAIMENVVEDLQLSNIPTIVLKQEGSLPFSNCYAAGQAGIDRLANVAAAIELGRLPAIVVDAGSAITFEVIGPDSVFRGGAILPGIRLQAVALHGGTASLPQITFEPEVATVGGDTQAAIQTGILHGCAGAIERLLQIMMSEPGMASASVIITGGDGPLLTQFIRREDLDVKPNLTVCGLYLLARHQYPDRFTASLC